MTPSDFRNSEAAEPYAGRARRFREECERFKLRFGISLDSEVDSLVPEGHLEKIRCGELEVIDGLRPHDLWAVLLSLHINLVYVLWGEHSPDSSIKIAG